MRWIAWCKGIDGNEGSGEHVRKGFQIYFVGLKRALVKSLQWKSFASQCQQVTGNLAWILHWGCCPISHHFGHVRQRLIYVSVRIIRFHTCNDFRSIFIGIGKVNKGMTAWFDMPDTAQLEVFLSTIDNYYSNNYWEPQNPADSDL